MNTNNNQNLETPKIPVNNNSMPKENSTSKYANNTTNSSQSNQLIMPDMGHSNIKHQNMNGYQMSNLQNKNPQ